MSTQQHAQHIAQLLQHAQQECRADVERVNDPKAQALFETIAEVLGGAMKALDDYQKGEEKAWQPSSSSTSSKGQLRETLQAQEASGTLPQHQRPAPQGPQPPVVTDMAVDISENEPPPRLFTE